MSSPISSDVPHRFKYYTGNSVWKLSVPEQKAKSFVVQLFFRYFQVLSINLYECYSVRISLFYDYHKPGLLCENKWK